MTEGNELYRVWLTERQMARITSALARHNPAEELGDARDATIFEMFQCATPIYSGQPPKIDFLQCTLSTAEGLMRACIDGLNGEFKYNSIDSDRLEFYESVFAAAHKYYFKNMKNALAERRDAPGLGKDG